MITKYYLRFCIVTSLGQMSYYVHIYLEAESVNRKTSSFLTSRSCRVLTGSTSENRKQRTEVSVEEWIPVLRMCVPSEAELASCSNSPKDPIFKKFKGSLLCQNILSFINDLFEPTTLNPIASMRSRYHLTMVHEWNLNYTWQPNSASTD